MPFLFASTLFVSATLLFLVQPMIAKIILPRFGGAPAVWNTCMVFFQALLLVGYVYAHASTAWLGVRRQAALQLLLLLLPLPFLPIAAREAWFPPPTDDPVPWLLGLLAVSVGLPFFVVSSSAPLLQRWYASTGRPGSEDPYYLYAASNLGSMVGLLGYPFLLERALTLQAQGWFWTAGYGVLLLLTAACAVQVWRAPAVPAGKPAAVAKDGPVEMGRGTRFLWVAWAFVPSSLLLGATTYLTTDLSPFPLLWVLPLALYLLSFILVFSRLPEWVHTWMIRLLPPLVLLQAYMILTSAISAMRFVLPIHLTTLFVVSMVCHGELARHRPPAQRLTEFYLWMSFGGMLGGLFNALAAPLIFRSTTEYPIAMVLACLLMPPWRSSQAVRPATRILDVALPLVLAALVINVVPFWDQSSPPEALTWLQDQAQAVGRALSLGDNVPLPATVKHVVSWGLPLALCLAFAARPLRLGLALGLLFVAGAVTSKSQYVLHERSFFGVLKVESAGEGQVARLTHGTTLHGTQVRSENPNIRLMPLLYYFPTGPIGQVFTALREEGRKAPVAVIGLGAGTLAAYAQPGQPFTFFDINPAVVRIATDMDYFTYYTESPAQKRIELGDARLMMEREPDGTYGLVVVDAFSSDAIPVHLCTREAVELYFRKMTEDGILAFHTSNKYIDLEPVFANIARELKYPCLAQCESQTGSSEMETKAGKLISDWVILARNEKALGKLAKDSRWRPARARPSLGVWTDDYSNLVGALRWR